MTEESPKRWKERGQEEILWKQGSNRGKSSGSKQLLCTRTRYHCSFSSLILSQWVQLTPAYWNSFKTMQLNTLNKKIKLKLQANSSNSSLTRLATLAFHQQAISSKAPITSKCPRQLSLRPTRFQPLPLPLLKHCITWVRVATDCSLSFLKNIISKNLSSGSSLEMLEHWSTIRNKRIRMGF